jgi:4-hydroxybenzoyl-CoA thioesterase
MPEFTVKKLVRMQHCDAAGIVFTPQYFNLFTEVLEDWWSDGIGVSFNEMLNKFQRAIPLKKAEAEFLKPSRLGDELVFSLSVSELGKASMKVLIEAKKDDNLRCFVVLTMVQVNTENFKVITWTEEWLRKFDEFEKK